MNKSRKTLETLREVNLSNIKHLYFKEAKFLPEFKTLIRERALISRTCCICKLYLYIFPLILSHLFIYLFIYLLIKKLCKYKVLVGIY